MTKKTYTKPRVQLEREIEALTSTCTVGDGTGGSGIDKLSFDPNTGACVVAVT